MRESFHQNLLDELERTEIKNFLPPYWRFQRRTRLLETDVVLEVVTF